LLCADNSGKMKSVLGMSKSIKPVGKKRGGGDGKGERGKRRKSKRSSPSKKIARGGQGRREGDIKGRERRLTERKGHDEK